MFARMLLDETRLSLYLIWVGFCVEFSNIHINLFSWSKKILILAWIYFGEYQEMIKIGYLLFGLFILPNYV